MGYTNWSNDTYSSLSDAKDYSTKSSKDIFSKVAIDDMMPDKIVVRESRDSDNHPNSLAVMVFLDDTGSMGRIPESFVKNELPTLMDTIIENGVEHPQILFGAINDHKTGVKAPIQVGQFESGTEELDKWLTSLALQSGGGGQNRESYLLAWLVGGRHTSIDCFEKRNEKGYLFTIGDEASWDSLNANDLRTIFGYNEGELVSDRQLLDEAQRLYNVYHIHVNEGSYRNDHDVLSYWRNMLNERLIILDDYHAICATIATIIAVQYGADFNAVTSKFSDSTAKSVTNALSTVVINNALSVKNDGVITL